MSSQENLQDDFAYPEYGGGGDYAGARRARRAFRFCVAAMIALTLAFWFSENYLRFDKSETQYRMSLTLHEASARPVLQAVVKRDTVEKETPTAKYVEALAAVEEVDMTLPCYETACKLNSTSASLMIKYGCQLFLREARYKEARERFREASLLPPKNALPRYLEAAALAATDTTREELSEAMALIARTNSSEAPVLFPQPLWHPTLPKGGMWYVKLQRDFIQQCCAPLYQLSTLIVGKAKADIDKGIVHEWDSWLEKLQIMGERLLGDIETEEAHLGATQAFAGIRFQLDALQQRRRISERMFGSVNPALIERTVKLEAALKQLNDFENKRDGLIETDRKRRMSPLFFCVNTFLLFVVMYLLIGILNRILYSGKKSWSLSHPMYAKSILISGLLLLLLLLLYTSFLPQLPAALHLNTRGVALGWYVVVAVLMLFGLIYPGLFLPSARKSYYRIADQGTVEPHLAVVKKHRRIACFALMRRYYGLLLGGFLLVLCLWILTFRIIDGLYPWQIKLLTTGLSSQEVDLVHQLQALLSTSVSAGI